MDSWIPYFQQLGATEPTWLQYQKDMQSWIFADPVSYENFKNYALILAGIHVYLTHQKFHKSRKSEQKPTVPVQCSTWAIRVHGLALYWLRRFQLKVLTRASTMHLINDDVQRLQQVLQDWLHNIRLACSEALSMGWTFIQK